MNNKKLEEYNSKYGSVPNNLYDRFLSIISDLNIKPKEMDKIKALVKRNLRTKYRTLSFIFYFTPQATPRPRYSKFTKSFYVKNVLNYNEIFKDFIENVSDVDFVITTPCEFECKTYFPIPKAMNRVESVVAEMGLIHNIRKPDWDNLGKTYSDMIQKHLIADDSLIYKGTVEKLYSFKPRIEITIRFAEDFDSKFNKNKKITVEK